jgi:hypothetical protein
MMIRTDDSGTVQTAREQLFETGQVATTTNLMVWQQLTPDTRIKPKRTRIPPVYEQFHRITRLASPLTCRRVDIEWEKCVSSAA